MNPMLTGYPGATPQPSPQAGQPASTGNSFIDKFKTALAAINDTRGAGNAPSLQPSSANVSGGAMPSFRQGFDVGGDVYGPPNVTGDQGLGSWDATTIPAGPSSLDKAADAFKTGNDLIYGDKKDGQRPSSDQGQRLLAQNQASLSNLMARTQQGYRQGYAEGGATGPWDQWTNDGDAMPAFVGATNSSVGQPSPSTSTTQPIGGSSPPATNPFGGFLDTLKDAVTPSKEWLGSNRDANGIRTPANKLSDVGDLLTSAAAGWGNVATDAARKADERLREMEAERAASALTGQFRGDRTLQGQTQDIANQRAPYDLKHITAQTNLENAQASAVPSEIALRQAQTDSAQLAAATARRDALGYYSDAARNAQTPEDWQNLKVAAAKNGVDLSAFKGPDWQSEKHSLQVAANDSDRQLALEMKKADLAYKQAEGLKADPYVNLGISSFYDKAGGMAPPDTVVPRSPIPSHNMMPQQYYGGATPQNAGPAPSVPGSPPLPSVPGISIQGAMPPASVPNGAPPQQQAQATPPLQVQPDATFFQRFQQILPTLPEPQRMAAMAAYREGLQTHNWKELNSILQKAPVNDAAQEFAKAEGKSWHNIYDGHLQSAGTARSMETTLGQFERALDTTKNGASTGATAQAKAYAANVLQSLGVDPKPIMSKGNLSQLELIQALGSQLTANMAKSLQQGDGGQAKGGQAARVTDADIKLFTESEPNISHSPLGNKVLLSVLRERNQLNFKLAEAAKEAQTENSANPIAARQSFIQKEEAAYDDYEKKRAALFNQAGFGPKEAGYSAQPMNVEAAVTKRARELGLSDDLTRSAISALQNKDPAAVMQRMEEIARQQRAPQPPTGR